MKLSESGGGGQQQPRQLDEDHYVGSHNDNLPHQFLKSIERRMKVVQMTLDEDLVRLVDDVCKLTNQSRSAFTRDALRAAIARCRIAEQEQQHRQGYERHPVAADEFAVWETEQDWGDS
jgi:predicted transcriptional regulator